MTPEELKAINDELDAEDLEDQDELVIAEAERTETARTAAKAAAAAVTPAKAPVASPAAPPAVTPVLPKPALGLGKDNVFRMTDAQARDPMFCLATQKTRAKAAAVETIPE